MSFLGDVGSFEYFNLGQMLDQAKENPARLLYGSADPFSTSVWNGILGTDDKPMIDQWGGAAPQRYQEAQNAGINTGPGKSMHGVARTIASIYAGGAAGSAMGGAGGASGGAAGMGGGTGVTAGSTGAGFTSGGATLGSGAGYSSGLGSGAGYASGMGSGSGVTMASAGSSGGLLGSASSTGATAASEGGLLASMQNGYTQAKPYMEAAQTGMKVAKEAQGEPAPALPPPQLTPVTSNQELSGILAQMNQANMQRFEESQMRKQHRRNLIGG